MCGGGGDDNDDDMNMMMSMKTVMMTVMASRRRGVGHECVLYLRFSRERKIYFDEHTSRVYNLCFRASVLWLNSILNHIVSINIYIYVCDVQTYWCERI